MWKQLLVGSTSFTHTDLNICGWRLFGLCLVGLNTTKSIMTHWREMPLEQSPCLYLIVGLRYAERTAYPLQADPNTCFHRRIKSCWIRASPPMNHHLRLTRARGDYCLPSQAEEQLWVWKQRHFFISFSLSLHIKKQTTNRRAVMQCVLVCMETLSWKANSSAAN